MVWKKLRKRTIPKPVIGVVEQLTYIWWADDFIITGSSKELLETEVKPLVKVYLKERGLELWPVENPGSRRFETGFDFLRQTRTQNTVYGKTAWCRSVKEQESVSSPKVLTNHQRRCAGQSGR